MPGACGTSSTGKTPNPCQSRPAETTFPATTQPNPILFRPLDSTSGAPRVILTAIEASGDVRLNGEGP